ncbi:MAG: response regulator [Spartobacteria bacterium]|nr:response regulator [Spartobacteria bacterium]
MAQGRRGGRVMTKKCMLLVDDDQAILSLLERLLANQPGDWEIRKAQTGEAALACMRERHVDVILTDFDMPGIDGATLLDVVARDYPGTVRMIFSGNLNDDNEALRLVETTHQVFVKPQSITQIRDIIKRAITVREYLPDERLEEVVSRIKTLPSLPDIYLQLVAMLNGDCSAAEIGVVIEQDLAMSAKVLQLVNSAFFGLRERVNNPAQAVNLLGVHIIKSLVLMSNVFTQFEDAGVDQEALRELWRHGMSVAVGARNIAWAEGMPSEEAEECFVCGLFHDIGKLILMVNMPADYEWIRQVMAQQECSLVEAERNILGSSHAEVGAYLLGIWGFSQGTIEAAAFHHEPTLCPHRVFSPLTVVHVANIFDYETRGEKSDTLLDEAYIAGVGRWGDMDEWREVYRQAREDED